MQYWVESVRPFEIDFARRQSMLDLLFAHFGGYSESAFHHDLEEKDEVLLLYWRDPTDKDKLVGFSTWYSYECLWKARTIRVVFSGDTVVAKAHWGQQALAHAWITRMGRLHHEHPGTPLYWFLIVKGHRTFKFLSAFGRSFWPHWAIDRSDLQPLADELASERFGAEYNPVTGVVEFVESRGHLRPEFAWPSEEELKKESVRFFLQRNPGYTRGHELVCICELSEENMRPLTLRIFRNAR